jgi:glycosyltransferase involved in cell wall biosynthesis
MTSVVITTKNEIGSIKGLLHSLEKQAGLGELVIVDGGSTDGTVQAIEEFKSTASCPVKIISDPHANIARGRNIAIENAQGEIIAVTDAGCEVGPTWLASLVQPMVENPNIGMVGGFFKAAKGSLSHNILSAVTIPPLYEIQAGRFLPSSRSFGFRKSVWQQVGKYPEWLPICEDLVFDLKLKRSQVPYEFAPDAWVTWFVRSTWWEYFWQYYRYARGDGHALLWPRRHMIRYATYLLSGLLVGLIGFLDWRFIFLLAAGFVVYMIKFWRRFFFHYPNETWFTYLLAVIFIPLLVIEGDIAKMIGYPIGRIQRWQGKIKPEPY